MDNIFSRYNILIYLIVSLIFIGASLFYQVEIGFMIVLLLYILFLTSTILSLRENFAMFCFLCTFFLFLLSSYTLLEFFGWTENVVTFSLSIRHHIYICLAISIVGLFAGYRINIISKFLNTRHINKQDLLNVNHYTNYRYVSLFFTYLFFIPNILISFTQYRFLSHFGYAETYLTNSVQVPYLISLMGYSFPIMYYIYLSTLPNKKNIVLPTLLYIVSSIFTLLSGQRSIFVINILVLLIYFFLRDSIPTSEKWIKKRYLLYLIVLTPFIATILYIYGQKRFDSNYESITSINNIFFKILSSQGVSVSVIGYGKVFEDIIPNKIYSLGGIIEFLKYNPISTYIFNTTPLIGQSQYRAFNGNLFTHTISYLVLPYNYVRGMGLGTSFIAEAYHDFSFFGVFIWSFIYGKFLNFTKNYLHLNMFLRVFTLISLRGLLMSPRALADGFISSFLNSQTFFSIALLFLCSYILSFLKVVKGKG